LSAGIPFSSILVSISEILKAGETVNAHNLPHRHIADELCSRKVYNSLVILNLLSLI